MKHAVLHSIAHNVADSLGSGSLLTGMYDHDLMASLTTGENSEIVFDFLTGVVATSKSSSELEEAARRAPTALALLVVEQGGDIGEFDRASARFWTDQTGGRFDVTVEDCRGRRTTREYRGSPGVRLTTLDALGRRRPKRAIAG